MDFRTNVLTIIKENGLKNISHDDIVKLEKNPSFTSLNINLYKILQYCNKYDIPVDDLIKLQNYAYKNNFDMDKFIHLYDKDSYQNKNAADIVITTASEFLEQEKTNIKIKDLTGEDHPDFNKIFRNIQLTKFEHKSGLLINNILLYPTDQTSNIRYNGLELIYKEKTENMDIIKYVPYAYTDEGSYVRIYYVPELKEPYNVIKNLENSFKMNEFYNSNSNKYLFDTKHKPIFSIMKNSYDILVLLTKAPPFIYGPIPIHIKTKEQIDQEKREQEDAAEKERKERIERTERIKKQQEQQINDLLEKESLNSNEYDLLLKLKKIIESDYEISITETGLYNPYVQGESTNRIITYNRILK